jgi:hypothetical protein
LLGRDFFKQSLERVLVNLAAPAERQIDYLQGLGLAPAADELALEFDDGVVGRVDAAVSEGLLSPRTAETVKAVDQALLRMSGDANSILWNFEALESRPEWEEIRQLALVALQNVRSDFRGS